jgi:hypothetical protein
MFIVYALMLDGTVIYYGEGHESYSHGDYGRLDTHIRKVGAALKKRLTTGNLVEMYNYIASKITAGSVFAHAIVGRFDTKGAAVDFETELIQRDKPAFNQMAGGSHLRSRAPSPACRSFGVRGAYAALGESTGSQPALEAGLQTGLTPEAYRDRRRERAMTLYHRRKASAAHDVEKVVECDAVLAGIDARYGVEPVKFRGKTTRNRPLAKMTEEEERAFLEPYLQRNARVSEICADLKRKFGAFSLGATYAMMRRCNHTPPKRRASKLPQERKAELRRLLSPLWSKRRRAELAGKPERVMNIDLEIRTIETAFLGEPHLNQLPPVPEQVDAYEKSRKRRFRENLLDAISRDDVPAMETSFKVLVDYLKERANG